MRAHDHRRSCLVFRNGGDPWRVESVRVTVSRLWGCSHSVQRMWRAFLHVFWATHTTRRKNPSIMKENPTGGPPVRRSEPNVDAGPPPMKGQRGCPPNKHRKFRLVTAPTPGLTSDVVSSVRLSQNALTGEGPRDHDDQVGIFSFTAHHRMGIFQPINGSLCNGALACP